MRAFAFRVLFKCQMPHEPHHTALNIPPPPPHPPPHVFLWIYFRYLLSTFSVMLNDVTRQKSKLGSKPFKQQSVQQLQGYKWCSQKGHVRNTQIFFYLIFYLHKSCLEVKTKLKHRQVTEYPVPSGHRDVNSVLINYSILHAVLSLSLLSYLISYFPAIIYVTVIFSPGYKKNLF